MAFDPLHYRYTQAAIGSPEDAPATDVNQPNSQISLLKRIIQIGGTGGGGGGGGELPPGAATAANQSAGNALLTSIEDQMNNPLPAGTNLLGSVGVEATYNTALPVMTDGEQGSLQLNASGMLLVTSSTSAAGLGKAEDVAHVSGAIGIMSLGVRKDTAATTVDADGDYTPLITDASGRQWVHVGAIEPGTSLIGKVSAAPDTTTIYDGTTARTPKFAVIDAAVSGDNTIVAAVASRKIRVLSLFVVAAGAVTVRFESGASGTALTGQMNLPATGGFVLPYNPIGWFETAVNTLLNLELSGAISVDGNLSYIEVA